MSDEQQDEESRRRRRVAKAKSYPTTPLEAVVKVAEAIRDNSNAREITRIGLAQGLDKSPGSSAFRAWVSDSAEYGLTTGNYNSEVVGLTDTGMSFVRPRDDSERQQALLDTALKPTLFAQLYGRLDQTKWPSDANLQNLLVRDFAVPPEFAAEAGRVARANAEFVGILQQTKGGPWLALNADLRQRAQAATTTEDTASERREPTPPAAPAAEGEDAGVSGAGGAAAPAARGENRDSVFVSHSKTPAILEQIKTILDFGRFIPVVAEEEETTAIPVPEKVFAAMRRCGSAVINVSADENERRDDGTYGINQNVLIEVGAAFALYDRRVVLVVDKRVQLPSNLQGLYRSEYEGDELGWTAGMKLQKALANFRER